MFDVIYLIFLDVDYRLRITRIVHQQLWGYKVEEKIYLEVRKRKRFNITDPEASRMRRPWPALGCCVTEKQC